MRLKERSRLHNTEVQGEEVNVDINQVLMKVILHSWFFMVLQMKTLCDFEKILNKIYVSIFFVKLCI